MKKLALYVVAALLVIRSEAAAQPYEFVDLGSLLPGTSSAAVDINENGDVLCWGNSQLFIWSAGAVTPVAVFGGSAGDYHLNNSRTVIGSGRVWQGGSSHDPGFYARGVNSLGSIIGTRANESGDEQAVRDGVLLGTIFPSSLPISIAYDVNDLGQVTGWATSGPTYLQHAFLWDNGAVTDLGTLGGDQANGRAINDHGHVVGISSTPAGNPHGFFWNNGSMTDIGVLASSQSAAYDINDLDQIVGWSGVAIMWQAGVMTDLNTLIPTGTGFVLNTAEAINNNGWVVGRATYQGHMRAYLLRPAASTPTNRSTWGQLKARYR